jgi:DinB superfamily
MSDFREQSYEATLFCRYIVSSLDRLLQALDGLSEKQLNWRPPAPNTNSLYTLTVHTMSNAEENILYTLFDRTSPREREQEFLAHGSSADMLTTRWQDLRVQLQNAILNLSSEDLRRDHNHPRRGTITSLDILIIVARHTAEHLGQAELTRDLLLAINSK